MRAMHALLHTIVTAAEWLRAQGPGMLPVAFLFFVVTNAALVPASVLSVALGFVYGFVPGFMVAALARPSAGLLACVLSRSVLRSYVQGWADRHVLVAAVDRALSRGGMRVIVLLRLSPIISSTVVNWALGVTRVSLRDFTLGTALGIVPSTLAYAYIGSGLKAASEIIAERAPDPIQTMLFWFGLAATLGCVVVVSRLARRELLGEIASSS